MSMSYQYIQLDYLELMSGGDADTRRQLLQMLITDLEDSLASMRTLWEKKDWQGLRQLLHHLKSTFPFVGNERLAQANRQMEQYILEKKTQSHLEQLFLEVGVSLPKVLKELRQELMKS